MALNSAGIHTAIAALTVSGVTIKDLSGMPSKVTSRECPIFYPVGKGGGTSEPSTGSATFGSPTGRMWLFNRRFEYVYLHAAVGEGRGITEHYSAMSAKEDAILTALLALDVSGVDVMNIETTEYGIGLDPSDNQFYSFKVVLTLREKVNA
jgi:hypothetical protein